MKFKKTYTFAFKSALQITILALIAIVGALLFTKNEIPFWFIIPFGICLFAISFYIIQYRVEKFIFKRVKKIYDEVSLLDVRDFQKTPITTDMETLSKEVKKFAEDKRKEIKSLNIRENYRREFLGNIAHELKTPLFTVQGYILTLLEGAKDDKVILNKYLDRAGKGVERLIDIVKDLDLISKLESDDLNIKLETFNAIELIQQVFDMLEMKAKKRNITLQFDTIYDLPIFVQGDVNRLEQVLINLIENSIKYGKDNGTTIVSLNYQATQNKYLISVKDNGEGIKKAYISRIFERFYRVEKSRSRDQGGSGLGLSIVKHIIEAHNQTITANSTFGEGTEFLFTLQKAN